jgi:phospholipase/carboxylesterase
MPMRLQTTETDEAVTRSPGPAARASVIWLHGLGADGHDFVPLVPELGLPDRLAVRFVFPHAPQRAVTINNGYVMRAWYDIKSLAPDGRADPAGLAESVARVATLVAAEVALGVPAGRIVIAGFSQGGAVALHAALRYAEPLAGVLALSSYLPLHGSVATEASSANRRLPILMCHGREDPVLPMSLAELSRDTLVALGYAVAWKEYPMRHEVCREEIADIAAWLLARLA